MNIWNWIHRAFCVHVYSNDIVREDDGLVFHVWECRHCGLGGRRLIGTHRITGGRES